MLYSQLFIQLVMYGAKMQDPSDLAAELVISIFPEKLTLLMIPEINRYTGNLPALSISWIIWKNKPQSTKLIQLT